MFGESSQKRNGCRTGPQKVQLAKESFKDIAIDSGTLAAAETVHDTRAAVPLHDEEWLPLWLTRSGTGRTGTREMVGLKWSR